MNTSTKPWRVVANEEGHWEVWTKLDATPGSRNNWIVADLIQTRKDAETIAAAPALLDALRYCEKLLSATEYSGEKQLGNGMALDQARAAIAQVEKEVA